METKDRINLAMSATALIISILATAVPLFRTVDDIRLVINELPDLKIDPDAILPATTLSGIRERALQEA